MDASPTRVPEHVTVVGAGIAGLSTAWHLLQRGIGVTVLDRSGVAAGSSWGNAGWITPGLAIPLAEPAVLKQGFSALVDPQAPLHIPATVDPGLWRFLLGFARRCTTPSWQRTMAGLVPLNRMALQAYDELEREANLPSRTRTGPIMAAFRRPSDAEALLHEFEQVKAAGGPIDVTEVSGEELRSQAPVVSSAITRALRIDGQRFLNPGDFLDGLAAAIQAHGGAIRAGAEVSAVRHARGGVEVAITGDAPLQCDAVVLATGAWLPTLAREFGVKTPLRAGRGYSFSVPMPESEGTPDVQVPVYFAHERVVCTPLGDRVRIGGTMEFRGPDAPLDPARIEAILASARPLVAGLDLDDRSQEWVGARPVTVDGLPLVGHTAVPGVWVHGGHGMWGMCQGPATGRLLAEHIVTGSRPAELVPLDPTR